MYMVACSTCFKVCTLIHVQLVLKYVHGCMLNLFLSMYIDTCSTCFKVCTWLHAKLVPIKICLKVSMNLNVKLKIKPV